jgi:hypothetical protein
MEQPVPNKVEELANQLATMARVDLVKMLRQMHVPFRMDFTDEYLGSVSLDHLRHLVLAASLHECHH